MKFLKSYSGAVLVTVVVIALSVLFGAHRSLTAEREAVEALFTQGADGSGYSIATDLEDCRGIAANLLTVAGRYLDQSELQTLAGSSNMLADWHGIAAAKTAYDGLMASSAEVIAKLQSSDLSEKDAGYVRGFQAELAAKADIIGRDPYHQRAEEFNTVVLGAFPARLLAKVTFVRPAETFR